MATTAGSSPWSAIPGGGTASLALGATPEDGAAGARSPEHAERNKNATSERNGPVIGPSQLPSTCRPRYARYAGKARDEGCPRRTQGCPGTAIKALDAHCRAPTG